MIKKICLFVVFAILLCGSVYAQPIVRISKCSMGSTTWHLDRGEWRRAFQFEFYKMPGFLVSIDKSFITGNTLNYKFVKEYSWGGNRYFPTNVYDVRYYEDKAPEVYHYDPKSFSSVNWETTRTGVDKRAGKTSKTTDTYSVSEIRINNRELDIYFVRIWCVSDRGDRFSWETMVFGNTVVEEPVSLARARAVNPNRMNGFTIVDFTFRKLN